MLRTNSYVKSYEADEVQVGCKYYFGELTDGSSEADESIHEVEDGVGAIGMYDDDNNELLVTFKVIDYNEDEYMDSLVEVIEITEL